MSEMVERGVEAMIRRRNLPEGCDIDREAFRADVRAIITELREPTPIMLKAGWAKLRDGRERIGFLLSPGAGLKEAHHAMVDEALR